MTHPFRSHLFRATLALAIVGTFPLALAAQQPVEPEDVQTVVDDESADRLLAEAVALEADQSSWVKAAKLYAKSADLRAYGDIRAHTALERAGELLYFSDRPTQARRMLAKAGDRALEAGEVYEGALAYTAAVEMGLKGAVSSREDLGLTYYRLALRLSESPILTTSQREDLRVRLGA